MTTLSQEKKKIGKICCFELKKKNIYDVFNV